MNNIKLKQNFKNKNYIYCINVIENEIIKKLVNRIKIFNPNYNYTNLNDLKNNCYRYLDDKEKIFGALLYATSIENQPNVKKLINLLDIYSNYNV